MAFQHLPHAFKGLKPAVSDNGLALDSVKHLSHALLMTLPHLVKQERGADEPDVPALHGLHLLPFSLKVLDAPVQVILLAYELVLSLALLLYYAVYALSQLFHCFLVSDGNGSETVNV